MPHASRLSDDGRFVAFSSWADNLAASNLVANDTNGTTDTSCSPADRHARVPVDRADDPFMRGIDAMIGG